MRNLQRSRKSAVQVDLQAHGRTSYAWRSRRTRRSMTLVSVSLSPLDIPTNNWFLADLPDLTDADNCVFLGRWEGTWAYLSTLKWQRISRDGTIQTAKFPPKGDSWFGTAFLKKFLLGVGRTHFARCKVFVDTKNTVEMHWKPHIYDYDKHISRY